MQKVVANGKIMEPYREEEGLPDLAGRWLSVGFRGFDSCSHCVSSQKPVWTDVELVFSGVVSCYFKPSCVHRVRLRFRF